jgi:hypothetical protein
MGRKGEKRVNMGARKPELLIGNKKATFTYRSKTARRLLATSMRMESAHTC